MNFSRSPVRSARGILDRCGRLLVLAEAWELGAGKAVFNLASQDVGYPSSPKLETGHKTTTTTLNKMQLVCSEVQPLSFATFPLSKLQTCLQQNPSDNTQDASGRLLVWRGSQWLRRPPPRQVESWGLHGLPGVPRFERR